MKVTALRIEHRDDDPCIDTPVPRLSWNVAADVADCRQTAYQVRVGAAGAAADGAWDSGRVPSSRTVDIEYAGDPLPPAQAFEWSVRVWDHDGAVTDWSPPATFHTAPASWHAVWVSRDKAYDPGVPVPGTDPYLDESDPHMRGLPPATHVRREFETERPVARATLFATARGLLELELNGSRVGDHELAPGWTDYDHRIEYDAHDVTALVRPGENVLGAILGDGWYAGNVAHHERLAGALYGTDPALLCELHLEHVDGGTTVITSDARWRASVGPIVYADLLMGERYDARRELGAWSSPGYDGSTWTPVAVTARDETALVPARAQPVRVLQDVETVTVNELGPAVFVADLGQNIVGRVRIRIRGAASGARVRLRFAEMLESDGSLYVENLRSAAATDTYVCAGGDIEEWEPRFTFHGFRYVEVSGLDAVEPGDITGRVIGSDTPRSGTFTCSDPLVTQLVSNIEWGQRGNFLSVPTDCPQRDERLGWLADAQVFLGTATLNCDVAAFMTKWGDDMLDAQLENGAYPDIAPLGTFTRDGAPAWADAGVIVPWILWRRYDDVRLVERHWSAMERYMEHLVRHNPDLLWTNRRGNDYGDWLSIDAETPRHVVATAYWAYDARLMSEMATALGLPDRAAHYDRLRQGITAAFQRAHVNEDGSVEGDTQTSYLLALHMDLLPEGLREQAADRLVADIEARGGHLSTGFVGVGLLCPVLSRTGHSDVAHRLLLQDSFPSWGYSIRHGATTIWERWDGWTLEDGFQTPLMNSFNHYSLGSVGEWLYEYVAGIRPVEPGYARVVIAPEPGELEWVDATYRSVRGPIRSAWRRTEGGGIELEVEIPPNVTASVVLPDTDPVEVGPGRHTLTS